MERRQSQLLKSALDESLRERCGSRMSYAVETRCTVFFVCSLTFFSYSFGSSPSGVGSVSMSAPLLLLFSPSSCFFLSVACVM